MKLSLLILTAAYSLVLAAGSELIKPTTRQLPDYRACDTLHHYHTAAESIDSIAAQLLPLYLEIFSGTGLEKTGTSRIRHQHDVALRSLFYGMQLTITLISAGSEMSEIISVAEQWETSGFLAVCSASALRIPSTQHAKSPYVCRSNDSTEWTFSKPSADRCLDKAYRGLEALWRSERDIGLTALYAARDRMAELIDREDVAISSDYTKVCSRYSSEEVCRRDHEKLVEMMQEQRAALQVARTLRDSMSIRLANSVEDQMSVVARLQLLVHAFRDRPEAEE